MSAIKIKHFVYTADWTKGKNIEQQVNEFLQTPGVELVDIKHSSSFNPAGNTGDYYTAGQGCYQYSTILIYKETV